MRRVVESVVVAALAALAVSGAAGRGATGTQSGVVVADNGGAIVLVNWDGSGARTLTHPRIALGEYDENPVASPDGTTVALTRWDGGGKTTEMVVHIDGTGLHKIGNGTDAAWSSDSKRLAFSTGPDISSILSKTSTGAVDVPLVSSITVVSADGSGKRLLARGARSAPAWSPDGKSIAYATDRGIEVVNIRSGKSHVLLAADDARAPAWSPDGSRIAYQSGSGISLMRADGTGAHPIGPPAGDSTPRWSPDAKKLAYDAASPRLSQSSVVVVDVSTGHVLSRIPPLAGGESVAPAWSPDGARIAFLRSREPGNYATADGDVWVAASDGSSPVELTFAFPLGGSHSVPGWIAGAASVVPDAQLAAPIVHPTGSKPIPGEYLVAAVDGDTVAMIADSNSISNFPKGKMLAIRRDTGPLTWIKGSGDRVALSGNRIYWSWYWSDHEGTTSELWTTTWPGGKAVRLAHLAGPPNGPGVFVAGDSSLVVYVRGSSLYRLQGTKSTRIRTESRGPDLLAVDSGRALVWNGRALEVIDGTGKVAASLPPGPDPVDATLSGDRVVLLDNTKIYVRTIPDGRLVATWPVGAPGSASHAEHPFGSLFPYETQNGYGAANFHVLDLTTGADAIVGLPGPVSPLSLAASQSGIFYTEAPAYSGIKGLTGVLPSAAVTAPPPSA
jgi:dipeptidyl aminopeptidase/acylaminoacyl peptidase